MSKSKIEWTDRTWNPVTGCTKVSQGCKNCYAERMFERFHGPHSFKEVICHEDRLTIPSKWKQPSIIFVNSMSDLFHEDVPFLFIDAVYRVMSDQDQHIYQVLTKRPKRMLEFYQWKANQLRYRWRAKDNVWIGVSVEDQDSAYDRIPALKKVPAYIRFLSCEPLLGPLNLSLFLSDKCQAINWVICGGESGPKARPMHPDWAISLRDQCLENDVLFFFKQWGEFSPGSRYDTNAIHHVSFNNGDCALVHESLLKSNHYSSQWSALNPTVMCKVGKAKAGRLLDGREYNQMPSTSDPRLTQIPSSHHVL